MIIFTQLSAKETFKITISNSVMKWNIHDTLEMPIIIACLIVFRGEKLYCDYKCILNIMFWPKFAGYSGVQEEGPSAGQAIPSPCLNYSVFGYLVLVI